MPVILTATQSKIPNLLSKIATTLRPNNPIRRQRPCARKNSGNEAFREERDGDVRQNEQAHDNANKAVPKDLALWLGACPEASQFGPLVTIEQAAIVGAQLVRSCGLARHAFESAAARLGAVNAGLLGLLVCQRHADGERPGGTPIRSPGGLFVMLARDIERGRHSLEKDLIAMQRRRRA